MKLQELGSLNLLYYSILDIMTIIRFLLSVSFLLLAMPGQGFVSLPSIVTSPAFIPTSLNLHPDQAADLEACAYELMKEAAQKAREHDTTASLQTPGTAVGTYQGPIAWCRRILQKSTANTKRP